MRNKHVFLSYRSNEDQFAEKLSRALHERNIAIWMDKLKGIEPGDDWIEKLRQALNDAAALIAVVTPDYHKSFYCREELHRVQSADKPVIPVLLRDTPLAQYPFPLATVQYIDFRHHDDPDIFNQQVEKLVAVILDKSSLSQTDAIPPLKEGQPLAGRLLDNNIQQTSSETAQLVVQDGLEAVLARGLRDRLDLLEEQLAAVMRDYLIEQDSDTRVLLDRKIMRIKNDYEEVEKELNELKR